MSIILQMIKTIRGAVAQAIAAPDGFTILLYPSPLQK